METAIATIIAALFGGAGVKLLDHLLNRDQRKQDLAAQIRAELREDIKGLRKENMQTTDELDEFKEKYYQLYEQNIALQAGARMINYKTDLAVDAIEETHPETHIADDAKDLPL